MCLCVKKSSLTCGVVVFMVLVMKVAQEYSLAVPSASGP